MKKFLVMLLAVAVMAPVLALAEEETVEKIPSPDQIKFFRVIKKENGSLFGIRIKNQNQENQSAGADSDIGANANGSLEKIAGPWAINLYEKIRQIGNSLWGARKKPAENLGTDNLTAEIISCLKEVIDTKDGAIKATVEISKEDLIQAIGARNTCQKSVLDSTDNTTRIQALKDCKTVFQKALRDSRIKANKSRNDAWSVYKTEVKACYLNNGVIPSSDDGNMILQDGGENLEL